MDLGAWVGKAFLGKRQRLRVHLEVRLVEVIGHVPPNLPELSPLLHHSVEECQHVDQGLEGGVRTLFQHFVGDLEVRCPHVELQPVGGLCDHLSEGKADGDGTAGLQPALKSVQSGDFLAFPPSFEAVCLLSE